MIKRIKKAIKRITNRLNVFNYKRRQASIQNSIGSKSHVNVVFFAVNVGMWKNDGLFQLLLKDEHFHPVVISFLLRQNTMDYWKNTQKEMRPFFESKGYPYYDSYDFKTKEWVDINRFSPDIVIYAQQGNYNSSHEGLRIEKLWNRCLFAYTPYGWITQEAPSLYGGLLTGLAWKIFVSTEFDKSMYAKYSLGKGKNNVVSGCSFADDISNCKEDNTWKDKGTQKYRIIWAPHHSILSSDLLDYSNFLDLAGPMLDLADKYKDMVQFAFKPHPRLIDKLYKTKGWGVEKTNNYYNEWATRPNTMYISGDYASLFKYSDALIHDCGAFTAEYLYAQKPVFYIVKSESSHYLSLNEFGRLCFDQHYKGHSIEDIEAFIENVVIKGNDPLKEGRKSFYHQYLCPPNNRSVAENMYSEFVSLINPQTQI